MSILIDKLMKDVENAPASQAKDLKWYIAKPIHFYSIQEFFKRVRDGIRVINGKSFAVHYKQDE